MNDQKHHLDQKAQWMYEESIEHGITPSFGIFNLGSIAVGAEIDVVRLLKYKEELPNVTVNGWIHYGQGLYFQTGSEFGLKHILDTGFRGSFLVNYEDRPSEHFYGLGNHSSDGDQSVFQMEQTTLEAKTGYDFSPIYNNNLFFGFQNVNIGGGHDGKLGQIQGHPTFTSEVVPGLHGDEMIYMGSDISRDTRDHRENSKVGSLERFAFSYREGLEDSNAKFFKYQLELAKYISLWSDRRVMAFRLYGENNNEISNGHVPFYQMARLGGFGDYPHDSKTLRGYDYNRFFDDSLIVANLEYRYNVWQYRAFKGDAVLFLDEGQVFHEMRKFKFNDFRESYGLGFRVSVADVTILSMEFAHGDEGSNVYVKSNSPF